MAELQRIERPDRGIDCRYWKVWNKIAPYGVCTLPANRGAFCNTEGPPNIGCPLPGWDYEEEADNGKET